MTGITETTDAISETSAILEFLLPAGNSLAEFSGPFQSAVIKLSSVYCEELMANEQFNTQKLALLGSGYQPAWASNEADRMGMINKVTDQFWGKADEDKQEGRQLERDEIAGTMTGLLSDGQSEDSVVIGMCILALSSPNTIFSE